MSLNGKCPIPLVREGAPAANHSEIQQQNSEAPQSPEDALSENIADEVNDEEERGFIQLCFTEIQLFSIGLALLILYSIDSNMRNDFAVLITRLFNNSYIVAGISILFLILPFSAGLFLSIWHAFSKAEKSWFEKSLMLFFAVIINAGTGLYLGWYILKVTSEWWLLLFALWNIICSVLLIFKFQYVGIDDSELYVNYISDLDATTGQVLFSTVITTAVLMFCRYRLELFWVISYSVCITYINSFGVLVRRMFFRRHSHLSG